MRERDQRRAPEIFRARHLGYRLRCHEHQLLLEHRLGLEARCGERLGHEGGLEVEVHHARDQRAGGSGREFHHHIGIKAVIARQDGSQARAGRALERAQPEHALGLAGAHLADRLVRQAQQAVRVGEQRVSLRRETDGAAFATEQARADMLLQLADARRHVGLHAIELGGRADDAAFVHDGAENLQGLEINCSHIENDNAE